ncbi:MAG TPA: hypothetical protein K8V30_10095 [Metalysinibacillus jejuensis]|uniref:HTH merR-type domain-containing protein n=1 Tax=Metalysinibacillus jejuensis TaxID=914327 RepID=A0A921NDR0_9BACL|nr:hypothetical protein [Metalysinibacillus jejuensis]
MDQKMYTTKDAAKFLNVSTATLTNYAKHLEDNGYMIARNPKNHRCFVGEDFARMKAMVILNRLRSIPFSEAAQIVTNEHTNIKEILQLDKDNLVEGDVPAVQQTQVRATELHEVARELDSIVQQVQAQDAMHKAFVHEVGDILEQQSDVIKQQNDLIEQLIRENTRQKKRSWLSRLLFR